ncbi:peroxiredoxin, partial [Halarcobacter anaerophilus]
MACDTGAKAIEETKVSNEENKKNIEKKEEKMSSSLVL